jgi:hypothetical protein
LNFEYSSLILDLVVSDISVNYLGLDVPLTCALLAQNTLPANYDLAGIASQGYGYLSWLY